VTRRGNTILRRLARLQESCRAALPPPAEPPAEPAEPGYEAAIDRVFGAVRRHVRHLRGQEAQTRMILARFEREDELKVMEEVSPATGMYARYRAFLERSWALRFEDPQRMVRFAGFAVHCSRRLLARRYGIKKVFDFQCEAQAALGNALRVAQRLDEAAGAMARARELFELGTRDLSLELFLLEREAALGADRRRFREAAAGLKKAYRGYRSLGDEHLAGRTLVQLGIYTTYAGHPEEALAILRRSLDLLDASRDPSVAYAAMHSQVWILCDCGRYREAERQLFQLRPFQQAQGGRVNRLKLRWLEGRIDAGLERLERAEATLLEVRDGMTAIGRAYDAALAALDLAAALLGRGKTRRAREVVLAAYRTFVALEIHREGLACLVVLRNCFEVGLATRAMVEKVAAFLRKLENDPEARFEG